MDIHFTARKFRAHKDIRDHAIEEVRKLDKYYDGIVRGNVILSYERSVASIKTAEINLHVFGMVLSAREQSDDFHKSIGLAVGKLERQLTKYKTKIRMKNKKTLRSVKEKTLPPSEEEE
jgi:putative sigma-54 modulation protein